MRWGNFAALVNAWVTKSPKFALLGLLGALLAAAPAAPAAASGTAGPGCAAHRRAVAHYSGGVRMKPQPAGAPIPCGMQTGFAGGESAIAVTNSGAVFYAPAVQTTAGVQTQYFLGGDSGFARTINGGASWSFVDPIGLNMTTQVAGLPGQRFSNSLGYPAWDQIDDKFYMDRTTGRLFWTDPDAPSEAVLWTDDDGLTWGLSELPLGLGGEWTQVTAARPVTSKPSGYPEVVYACGEYDSVSRDVSTTFEGDICQKSLDGGQSWIAAGQGFFGSPIATHAQCDGKTESPNFSPWAAPDPQGRLYELLFCDGNTFLIRSSNEGASWPIYTQVPFKIPNVGPGNTGSAELRTDARGDLYLAWTNPGNPNPNGPYAPGKLYLATSTNAGRSWSRALAVLAPGVQGIRTHFGFDLAAPGHVAFSYLGKAAGRNGFDGYITESGNVLAKRPLFWSTTVNDPSQVPLDVGSKGSSNGLGLDYVSVAIGPNGMPWASFWDDCGERLPQSGSGCPPSRQPTPGVTTLGFVDYAGRLAAAPPAPHRPKPKRHHPHVHPHSRGVTRRSRTR
jgi:hypothetical protein